ncbi:MAG: hypothetical protein GY701_07610 [Sulfitobacter sp.]|nr:hypothetical protein [Sulfitobacter sp.]
MTRCRRSGREFFELCSGLLQLPLEIAVRQCRARFPPGKGPLHLQADMHLVLSHRRRRDLNSRCQAAATARYKTANPTGLVARLEPTTAEDERCGLNRAQPFDLFAGTRLIGANNDTRRVCNGGFLTVGEVRETECDVTDEQGGTFTLSHQQVCRSTRLAWAITVTSSQSREFDCSVCLWDLGSPHYTKRHLYVAMSRVRRPESLVVAP